MKINRLKKKIKKNKKLARYLGSVYRFFKACMGREIAQKYLPSNGRTIYFVFCSHIGDMLKGLPYISLYKAYRKGCFQEEKELVVVTTKNYAGFVRMNPDVNRVILINKKELSRLNIFALSKKNKREDLFGDSGGISSGIPYEIPVIFRDENPEYCRIPARVCKDTYKDCELFKISKGIIPERTAILAPYAQASSQLSYEMMEGVISFFHEIGFSVFTNTGLGETAFPGTEGLDAPVDIVLALVSMGTIIIGAQCGLMDICRGLQPSAKQITVFPLKTDLDKAFYHNRGLCEECRIDRYYNGFAIALMTGDDERKLVEHLISLVKYYLKGILQKKRFEEMSGSKCTDKTTISKILSDYFYDISHREGFVIIAASAGVEKKLIEALLKGISANADALSNYFVVYDTDTGLLCNESNDDVRNGAGCFFEFEDDGQGVKDNDERYADDPICRLKLPLKNYGYVLSIAKDKTGYFRKSIQINGVEYASEHDGLDIVVYSKRKSCVIAVTNWESTESKNDNMIIV